MGAVDGVGKSVVISSAESTFSPFKRNILIITAIFFVICAFVGIFESFEQNSFAPLYHRTLEKVVASDHQLGRYVESLASGDVPHFEGLFVKVFPHFLWFWFLFIVNVVANLYFVFFFGWFLYFLWSLHDDGKILRNIIFGILCYLILSFLIGTAIYIGDMSGKSMPKNSLGDWIDHSYPFEGTVKFVTFFINRDSLVKVANWSESPIGAWVTVGHTAVNESEVNVTG